MAASTAAIEVVHARSLLQELCQEQQGPTDLGIDNSGALDIAHDPMHRGRSMHIERRHLKIRELVSAGVINAYKVPTEANLSDFLTKAMNPRRFRLLRSKLMTEP